MATTPMLKQYHAIKARHQDCILFFRLGDFYEMFDEDAKTVARELDLVLTARGKGTDHKVPMCGFPYHAADNYIARLIKAGYKVAICEQTEDPAQAKGLVKRAVTRVITSGTFLDENSAAPRYLLCLSPAKKHIGLAFTDPSSGTIHTNQYPTNIHRLGELIGRLPIYECVFPEDAREALSDLFDHPLVRLRQPTLSPYDTWCFNPDIARKTLCEHFGVHNLHGFGIEDLPAAIAGTGGLLEYLKHVNKQPLRHIDRVALYTDEDYVFISPAAHRGLELDTLVRTLDHTITPMGRRLWRFWFHHPLKNTPSIQQRQQAVVLLRQEKNVSGQLKNYLSQIPDIEKNISRLSCGYTQARDFLAIRNTLVLLPDLRALLSPLAERNALFALEDMPDLRRLLEKSINADVPLSHSEGKVIRAGYHQELDQLRDIQENGRAWLKKLQEEEIQRTGIPSLKIGFNKVFGYYIEVTRTHLKSVPPDFIRKQTLVNAERFITPKLKEYEEKILTAQEKILKIENALLQEIQKHILDQSLELHQCCEALARVDALHALSCLADAPGYVCPEVDDGFVIDIKEGRHPVVEKTSPDPFVANNTLLDDQDQHLVILTGPNMAGKSTYIRQTALLTIMAQTGSFIPARSARIGVVDKIFTRIGAHDDINKGQSTFMVEMNETADILNNLTPRSLIILDEIGRGTSTYDGLSLAWALAEHLHKTRARTLFATHFHEITALSDALPGVKNYNVAVKEWKDEIIFLHKIVPGSTDDSYGIYVAKLAGIPSNVIQRARAILAQLEQKNLKKELTALPTEEQPDLFPSPTPDPAWGKIQTVLKDLNISSLTPLEALNILNDLHQIIKEP